MNCRRRLAALILIIGTGLAVACYAGDGFWEARGHVVGVTCNDAKASSIVKNAVKPPGGRPLPGAKVSLYLVLKRDGTPDRESIWSEAGTTDSEGYFSLGQVGDPHLKRAGLEASAPGYQSAYAVYQATEVQPERFVALMRPESCP